MNDNKRTRVRTQTVDEILGGGKIQPQAIELEEVVLGALMTERDIFETVSEILIPESFYKESNSRIFSVIRDLYKKLEPIDILTVTQELRKRGELDIIGGAYYITQLTNKVSSTAHVEKHAKLVAEKFIQRELIRIGSEIQREAFNEGADAFELMLKSERFLIDLRDNSLKTKEKHIHFSVTDSEQEYKEASKQISGIIGGKTGIYQLDTITRGFKPTQNIVIAGRPSMGKTAIGLQIIKKNCVEDMKPMGIFSLEMSAVQLTQRLIASVAQVDFERLQAGKLLEEELENYLEAKKRIKDSPIYIDDTAGLTNTEFQVRVKRMKSKYGIVGVVGDYAQLRNSETEKDPRLILIETTRTDKRVAKANNIYVVDLAQIGRSAEKNPGKRPFLSDLKESGSLEEDADLVIMLYRPEYYGIDNDAEGNTTKGKIEFIVGKNRNGYTGSTWGYWQGDKQSFHSSDPLENLPF